jgi:hydroxyacylglutathione hydrolase
VTGVPVDAWDLRHLLLSLDDSPRGDVDRRDLDVVAARVIAALEALAPCPSLAVPPEWTAPALVEGRPLWIMETNGWLLAPDGPGGDCLVVDVPPAPDALAARVQALELRPVAVALTHGHADHAGGVSALLEALDVSVPVHVHPADRLAVLHPEVGGVVARVAAEVRPPPASSLVPLVDGTVLTVGSLTVRAVHTPGHTPGSTCLLVHGASRPLLFSGDALFAGGTGRCDQEGGSRPVAEASLASSVAPLGDETVVLPGHGPVTTVGTERSRSLTIANPTLAA